MPHKEEEITGDTFLQARKRPKIYPEIPVKHPGDMLLLNHGPVTRERPGMYLARLHVTVWHFELPKLPDSLF